MNYQLVIQLPDDYFATHDELVAFEQRLIATLPKTCDVDGYDIGSGTCNFFIFTAYPVAAYKTFRSRIATRALERRLRIAYRDVKRETFTNLWPRRDPREFKIMYGRDEKPWSKRGIPKRSPRGTRAV
ncbi:MAG: hypothetical protein QM831_42850 [Kofleriaceae bacterium]